jgi:hypothetical protein
VGDGEANGHGTIKNGTEPQYNYYMNNLTDILNSISSGEFDKDITLLSNAIINRRDRLNYQMLNTIRPGDTIMFNGKCRPKYLRGVKATVKGFGHNRIIVDLAQPIGRFSRNVRVPLGIYTKVG